MRFSVFLVVSMLAVSARAAVPFDDFIVGLRSACARAPAATCAGAIGAYLDSDADGGIELREVERARDRARRAARDEKSALNSVERSLIAVALMVFKHAGLPEVFANFDADADGRLSQAELFADFRLDRRSFKDVIADPDAVDWKRFAGRFGKVGFLITDLLPSSHRKKGN